MVAVKSAMAKWHNASTDKAALGNGSIASAMLDEGNPVKMLVEAVKSAMCSSSNASAVNAAMGNGSIASHIGNTR